MAYITLSHFLPNDRQKKRKKLQLQTYQDPRVPTASMSTFRGVPNQSYLGWMLHTPKQFDDDVAQKEEIEMMPIEKAATRCKNIVVSRRKRSRIDDAVTMSQKDSLSSLRDIVNDPSIPAYVKLMVDLLLETKEEIKQAQTTIECFSIASYFVFDSGFPC
ncbi:unnamed protein product [Heligmosomoides polygyrus]|uniref:BESS domain-containing protein n=1 Tax=Heligmosomoides polygyrus TaxID=6339 RepID=A0A183FSH7_HELPZ|nr:unnamed protein product [Heligmosomoides polygyrus]